MLYVGIVFGICLSILSYLMYIKVTNYRKLKNASNDKLLRSLMNLFNEDYQNVLKINNTEISFLVPHTDQMFDQISYWNKILSEYMHIGCHGVCESTINFENVLTTIIKIKLKKISDELIGYLRINGIYK